MVVTYKDWAKKLPFALWGYRTSIRASTKATPYTLVYGSEAILPIEVQIQSSRVLVEIQVQKEDWMRERFEQLALIDEKRARAQNHAQGYQKRIARAFNKKVKPRNLKERYLFLMVLRYETFDPRGKEAKMVWAFYYQEDYVRMYYKNYRFGWRKDASPNQHGQTLEV